MLSGERILVTGATGQVARPIAEQLNSAGNEVWAAARFRDAAAKAELEAQGIKTAPFTMGEADLTHLPDVDYVIHCAADTAPREAAAALQVNAEGSGFLMKRYRDAKAFFHMSSSSVYREKPEPDAVYAEGDLLGGYSSYAPHYAMSKLVSEGVVRFQSRELGLPTIMARLNVAYGTCGHGGLPNVLFEFLKNGIPYQHVPGVQSYCSPIHEDDIVKQVSALVQHAEVGAPVINLGGDDPTTIEAVIAYLEELTGLSMTYAEGPVMFETQILDGSARASLAGPCEMGWRDGVKAALTKRHPDALA